MNQLNTLPIENFLNKARIAIKSNQKHLTLDIKDVQMMVDSLSVVMTRIAGDLDEKLHTNQRNKDQPSINMDGGGFGKF
jgi:hypothetical protein